MKQTKSTRGELKSRPRHSTHRELRGRDRRAEKRTEREVLVIVLHPALFERQVAA